MAEFIKTLHNKTRNLLRFTLKHIPTHRTTHSDITLYVACHFSTL